VPRWLDRGTLKSIPQPQNLMKVLLFGYYGYKNIGDDLFVKNLITQLATADRQVSVLCEDDYYKADHGDNPNVRFYKVGKLSKLKRLWLIWRHDYIVWGGGTLNISDKPVYLLTMQKAARLLRKQFGFVGIGLDGLSLDADANSSQLLFDRSDFLYLRDRESYKFAQAHLTAPKIICEGGDLAFLNQDFYQPFLKSDRSSAIKHLSFCGKHWWGDGRAEFYVKPLLELIEKYGTHIHLLPGNIGAQTNDNKFHEKMQKFLPAGSSTIYHWESPEEFLSVLTQMDFHIGNRLHSIILADLLGVPSIGINAEPPKILAYLQKTNHLVKLRSVQQFLDEITIAQIEQVFQQYARPSEFIQHEATTAQACLVKIFGDC
jgi:polysaccharide pyruvyl transferase WcaK-like protein